VKGRKRHIVTDTGGLLVGAEIHPADVQDRDGAVLVVEAIRSLFPWLRHLFADSAYAGPKLEAALAKLGKWTIEIVKRTQNAVGFELLPRRWVVERTLAWLNRNRRLAKSLPPRRRGISKHPSPVPRLGSSWPPYNSSLGE
jgi:transposase